MLEKLKNLKVGYKLGLMTILMGIPVGVFAYFFIHARNQEVARMQRQVESLDYLAPVHSLQEHVITHGGLTLMLAGYPSYLSKLKGNEAEVESDFTNLQQVDARLGKLYGTTEALKRIREHWVEIRNNSNSDNVFDTKALYDAHARLSNEILDLIRAVGDNGIVLDTSLDTYYLGNLMLLDIPNAVEYMGQLRYVGSDVILSASITDDQRNRLATTIARIRLYSAPDSGGIQTGIATAVKINPGIETRISNPLTASLTSSEAFIQSVQQNFLESKPKADLESHFAIGSDAIRNVFKLYEAVDAVYRTELGKRISDANKAEYLQLGLATLGFLLTIVLVWQITRGINRQVGTMTKLFSAIGIGDFSARAEVLSRDELGQATASLNAMLDGVLSLIQSREERDRIQDSIRKLLDEISGLAEGDLTKQAEVTAEITGAIADAFNTMSDELRNIISKVLDTTVAVTHSATEVQSTTEHLASGSESQAQQIVDASAAIDEMAVSIQQVSGNASSAAGMAETALNSAKLGTEAVHKTIEGMNGIRQQVQQTAKRIKRLGESSQEIGEIVQLINDIAERTTILALNASIQAAMAGDAGKGFAVVAEEVERLAEHSTDATKKISGLIKSIQTDTNEAIAAMEETTREVVAESGLANEAGQKLADIEKNSTHLAEIIQSISLASKQQSRGSEGVAKSMSEISQVTQQTAAGAKQAAISIRKLAKLADDLHGSLDRFKLPGRAA